MNWKNWFYSISMLLALCCAGLQGRSTSNEKKHHPSGGTPKFHIERSKIITGNSPFPCAPPVIDPASHPWPNTQVEPSLAVGRNPINRDHPMIAISYQEDRYDSFGGSSALYMLISLDGGLTFGKPIPLPTVQCFGGPFERDTNGHVAIANNGEIYFSSVPFDAEHDGLSTTQVSKFNVKKNKFTSIKYLQVPFLDLFNPPFVLTDFDGFILDPQDKTGKTAYVNWTFGIFPTGNPFQGQSSISFSKTTDGGEHWSNPRTIVQLPQSVVAQFPGGDVGAGVSSLSLLNNPGKPYSKLLISYFLAVNGDIPIPPYTQLNFPYTSVSSDQGKTWSNPIPVNNTNDLVPGQIVDPDNFSIPIRTSGGGTLQDRERNIIYTLNQEHSLVYDGIPTQIVLYTSTDDAASWNRIGPVNTVLSTQAFGAAMSFVEENKIAISYYDFRNHTVPDASGPLQTDRWMDIYSYDKKSQKLTLETELRLTETSFNHRNAPSTGSSLGSIGGLQLGDYNGQVFFERKIYCTFAVVPDNNLPNQAHLQFTIINQERPIPGNQ